MKTTQLSHASNELMNALEFIRLLDMEAYTNLKLTVSNVQKMLLVQEAENAYLHQKTEGYDIYTLDLSQSSNFTRYIQLPFFKVEYQLYVRKQGSFCAIYGINTESRIVLTRKYLRNATSIADILNTFQPFLQLIDADLEEQTDASS